MSSTPLALSSVFFLWCWIVCQHYHSFQGWLCRICNHVASYFVFLSWSGCTLQPVETSKNVALSSFMEYRNYSIRIMHSQLGCLLCLFRTLVSHLKNHCLSRCQLIWQQHCWYHLKLKLTLLLPHTHILLLMQLCAFHVACPLPLQNAVHGVNTDVVKLNFEDGLMSLIKVVHGEHYDVADSPLHLYLDLVRHLARLHFTFLV